MQKAGETVRLEVQFFSVTGDPLTGATVTVNVYKDDVIQVSGGSATERSAGRYSYSVSSATEGRWVGDFSTADEDADLLTVSTERIVVADDYFQTDVSLIPGLVWDESASDHNIPNSFGRKLRQLSGSVVIDGTAQGSGIGTNQIQLDTDASSEDGAYDPGMIMITNGTGVGQSRIILQYDGNTKTATVNRDWKITVDNTSEYVIIAHADLNCVNEGLIRASDVVDGVTMLQLNANASFDDDAYNGQGIFIVSGHGADQLGIVKDYDGTTQTAILHILLPVTPDTTSAYIMLPLGFTPILDDIYHLTHTEVGDPITRIIPPPSTSDTCRIWDWCYDQAGSAPVDDVTPATAKIISLPYDYGGKLHSGDTVEGTYAVDPDTGNNYLYWDIVWEAQVRLSIPEFGVLAQITVPKDETEARIAELIA